jgi:type I restriction enzyme, S subunit
MIECDPRLWRESEWVERLTPSVLAKAFRGELVEQDPDDEPAEKLLERIGSLRQNGMKKDKVE